MRFATIKRIVYKKKVIFPAIILICFLIFLYSISISGPGDAFYYYKQLSTSFTRKEENLDSHLKDLNSYINRLNDVNSDCAKYRLAENEIVKTSSNLFLDLKADIEKTEKVLLALEDVEENEDCDSILSYSELKYIFVYFAVSNDSKSDVFNTFITKELETQKEEVELLLDFDFESLDIPEEEINNLTEIARNADTLASSISIKSGLDSKEILNLLNLNYHIQAFDDVLNSNTSYYWQSPVKKLCTLSKYENEECSDKTLASKFNSIKVDSTSEYLNNGSELFQTYFKLIQK